MISCYTNYAQFRKVDIGTLRENSFQSHICKNRYNENRYSESYNSRYSDINRELSIDKQTSLNNPIYEKSAPKLSTKLNAEEAVMGRKVKHPKFGIGTIVSVSKDGKDIKLTIAFENMGIKNLLLDVAPLETA